MLFKMRLQMKKSEVNIPFLCVLIALGCGLWFVPVPHGLDLRSWHLAITFLLTITGVIGSVMPMGAVAFMAVLVLVLTKTLPIKDALSGFGSPVAWLVVFAFFIARGLIKTNLGKRIAYLLISKFGRTVTGLSYSLIATEFILSPMIPSTSARGGGVIYPIAKSLASVYDGPSGKKTSASAFMIATCFHSNVICCALFLTAMAGNPLIASLGQQLGANITWTSWATAAIVPGLINLLVLPYLLAYLIKPEQGVASDILTSAEATLAELGKVTRPEKVMIATFVLMLSLWIFGGHIGIDAASAGLFGFLILIITGVLRWEDATSEKAAWETFMWFAILLMLSENLAKHGIDQWVEHHIRHLTGDMHSVLAFALLGLIYFYGHYFFASVTAHVTVMFATFLLLMIETGIPATTAGLFLALISNLSAGLTHYGINTAPIYFSAGYFSTKQWLKIGVIVATFNLILWLIVGGLWWKVLGLW
jgi:DASS family divalent anion:Na+ symporter